MRPDGAASSDLTARGASRCGARLKLQRLAQQRPNLGQPGPTGVGTCGCVTHRSSQQLSEVTQGQTSWVKTGGELETERLQSCSLQQHGAVTLPESLCLLLEAGGLVAWILLTDAWKRHPVITQVSQRFGVDASRRCPPSLSPTTQIRAAPFQPSRKGLEVLFPKRCPQGHDRSLG